MAENLLDRIAKETDLTKSERKLAAVILKDPASVINENRYLHTHPPITE